MTFNNLDPDLWEKKEASLRCSEILQTEMENQEVRKWETGQSNRTDNLFQSNIRSIIDNKNAYNAASERAVRAEKEVGEWQRKTMIKTTKRF